MFIDVSVIARHDAGTGIQRVVRAVGRQLVSCPPQDWEVHAVGATRKHGYRTTAWPTENLPPGASRSMGGRQGDVFLGLDFSLDAVCRHERQLAASRQRGMQLWFVVHDFLPIQRPEWFSDQTVVRYRKWLRVIASLADGYFCNSLQTQSELREQLLRRYALADGYHSRLLPMGWDLATGRSSSGVPAGFGAFVRQITASPTALMVGTLEPRKGHADVLAAFEILWQKDCPYNLLIVGRPGWKTERLQDALRAHAQRGVRLFWLDDASDEMLETLYAACRGVLMASFAEGLGLPLVEAIGYGKPVLARNLTVFHQHECDGVSYFPVDARPADLAQAIDEWMGSTAESIPTQRPADFPSWKDAAQAIWSAVMANGATASIAAPVRS